MKGLFVSGASNIDWDGARAMLAERNHHLYLQYLLLGFDVDIECHLVVPMQYGAMYTACRTRLLNERWQQHKPALDAARLEVLEKQERCLTCCAVCGVALEYN